MIGSLTGTLQHKGLDGVVVDVGGVGYLVHVSLQTLAELPAEGARARLLCHTHVREDALQLYGFLHDGERTAFELLKTVSGVGPKLAMTILSGLPVQELVRAVADADLRRLTHIPGVGKKTAERLVVELKDRFAAIAMAGGVGQSSGGGADGGERDQLVAALTGLGYKRPLAERVVDQVIRLVEGESRPAPEELLRRALAAIQEL